MFELGIPVVETEDRFHVDIQQKVPLNRDRDNVTPGYLRDVRTAVLNATAHMLDGDDCHSAIVFTRTKHRARQLADKLSKAGHRAVGLQGNMSQGQRDRAMGGFRARHFDVLVATDIAARGIDVSGVSYVINYDVPSTPEAYTHRIGRTGRAELEGTACTFVTGADRGWVRATERMIGSEIPRRQVEGFDPGSIDAPPSGSPRPQQRPHARGPRSGGQQRNGQRKSPGNGRSRRRAS